MPSYVAVGMDGDDDTVSTNNVVRGRRGGAAAAGGGAQAGLSPNDGRVRRGQGSSSTTLKHRRAWMGVLVAVVLIGIIGAVTLAVFLVPASRGAQQPSPARAASGGVTHSSPAGECTLRRHLATGHCTGTAAQTRSHSPAMSFFW